MNVDEDQLLADSPTVRPQAATKEMLKLGTGAQVPDSGSLSKTQRKNLKARQKRKQQWKQLKATTTAATVSAPVAAVESPAEGTAAPVVTPPTAAPADATGQGVARPNRARPTPRSLFQTAWRSLLDAKSQLNTAMNLMKFYRYDG